MKRAELKQACLRELEQWGELSVPTIRLGITGNRKPGTIIDLVLDWWLGPSLRSVVAALQELAADGLVVSHEDTGRPGRRYRTYRSKTFSVAFPEGRNKRWFP